jgi:hypothetical protein
MSQYSKEIEGLMSMGIAKTIDEISSRIGNYGAYTFNSNDVKGWTDALSYYTAVSNFLDEYIEGNEEMDFDKLKLVLRFSMSNVYAGSSSAVSTSYTPIPVISVGNVALTINSTAVASTGFLVKEDELYDVKAEYLGEQTIDLIRIEIDSIAVADESKTVFLNNYRVNYTGTSTKIVSVLTYLNGSLTPEITEFELTVVTI